MTLVRPDPDDGTVAGGTNAPRHTPPHARRLRGESGVALVETALIIPILALLLGIAYTAYSSMQQSIRLTTAARAAAIKAANELQADIVTNGGTAPTGAQLTTALADATAAVNQEEGVTNVYQAGCNTQNNCVNMTEASDNLSGTGVTI